MKIIKGDFGEYGPRINKSNTVVFTVAIKPSTEKASILLFDKKSKKLVSEIELTDEFAIGRTYSIQVSDIEIDNDLDVILNLNCEVDAVRLPESRKQAIAAIEEDIAMLNDEEILTYSKQILADFASQKAFDQLAVLNGVGVLVVDPIIRNLQVIEKIITPLFNLGALLRGTSFVKMVVVVHDVRSPLLFIAGKNNRPGGRQAFQTPGSVGGTGGRQTDRRTSGLQKHMLPIQAIRCFAVCKNLPDRSSVQNRTEIVHFCIADTAVGRAGDPAGCDDIPGGDVPPQQETASLFHGFRDRLAEKRCQYFPVAVLRMPVKVSRLP